MWKTKLQEKHERIDDIADKIDTWMKFELKDNIKLKRKEVAWEGIEIEWIEFKKWMKFELQRDLRLKKKHFWEEVWIEIDGEKKFHFHENDIIVIEWVKKDQTPSITFSVERKRKKVENDENVEIEFTADVEKFLSLFESYADLEISMFPNFRFKQDDTIEVVSTEFIKYENEDSEKPWRKEITFVVVRKWQRLVDIQGDDLEFTFNASIFVDRFEHICNIEKVTEHTKQEVGKNL